MTFPHWSITSLKAATDSSPLLNPSWQLMWAKWIATMTRWSSRQTKTPQPRQGPIKTLKSLFPRAPDLGCVEPQASGPSKKCYLWAEDLSQQHKCRPGRHKVVSSNPGSKKKKKKKKDTLISICVLPNPLRGTPSYEPKLKHRASLSRQEHSLWRSGWLFKLI